MMRNELGHKLAKELCEKFPSATTMGLAKKLYKEHPKHFTSLESTRDMIRYLRGEHGQKRGQKTKAAGKLVQTTKKQRLSIPDSSFKPILPYKLTVKGSGLLLADSHIPYHDVDAVEMALEEAIQKKHTDFVILLGDFIDHYSLSSWEKDPEERRFKEERAAAIDMLKELKRIFTTVIYKGGNHEKRYERYMRMKAPELIGIEELEFDKIMQLDKLGITWVDWNRVIYVGDHLTLLHGHEYPRGLTSPVNPARGMFLKASACTVSAHQHQASTNNKPTIRGKLISNWSLGCTCGLTPEYSPLNNWNNGWAFLKTNGKDFEIENRKLINGQSVPA